MAYKYDKVLDEIIERNFGTITTAQAREAGIAYPTFFDFVERRGLERQSRGVYLDPDAFPDGLALFQARFPKIVYSHATALFIHDMTDRDPLQYEATVSSSYNASALKKAGVLVYYSKPELYGLGITEVQAPTGSRVRVYDKERTICDIVKARKRMDPAVFRQGIKEYVKSKDKDLARLTRYSVAMGLEQRVSEIMGVAL